jgi:hypothetical protein
MGMAKLTKNRDIETQVRESLPGIDFEYDVTGIVREIVQRLGLVKVDDVETSVYWAIVARHDLSGFVADPTAMTGQTWH